MSIFDLVMNELDDRGVYKYKTYAPFFISSFAMHVFNLYNQRQQIYWETKRLPNMRTHLLFVAPPGFMKCVTGDTEIQMSSGITKKMEDITIGDDIVSLDMDTLKVVDATVKDVYISNKDSVIKVTTRSGLEVTVTPEHPLLAFDGWMRTDTLNVGDKIAIPRRLESGNGGLDYDEMIVLAGMIAEGGLTSSTPTFTNGNKWVVKEFEDAFKRRFNGKLNQIDQYGYRCVADVRLNDWLREFDLKGLRSNEKFIPDKVFESTKENIATFLRMYTSCDGNYNLIRKGSSITITSSSEMIIKGLRELLLRFELVGTISSIGTNFGTISHVLTITGAKYVRRYLDEIGSIYPTDNSKLPAKSATIRDTIPLEVYDYIPKVAGFKSWNDLSNNTTIRTLSRKKKGRLSRSQLMEIANRVDSEYLKQLAVSDIFWDEIVSMKVIDEDTKVYDIHTSHGNFVGNGIFLHNSFYMSTMGSDKYSILRKAGIKIGSEQYMCLPAGQQVRMSDGTNKNIEDIKVGDEVLSLEYAKIVPTGVTDIHSMMCDKLLKIILDDDRSIILTLNHPLFTAMGWQESKDLMVGENVACNEDNNIIWLSIKSIEELDGERVYNLSTENHTFIAQNIITHNTEAGFVGTMQNIGGVSIPVEGAAKMYADGFIIIDEFSAITKALQMQHSNQLDNQLLSALDHGHVTKRLGSGKIEFDTRMTLWAGVQPARFDLTSGMGRRLMYMVFIPSKLDNEYLMDSMHASRNLAPNKVHMNNMWSELRQFKQDVEGIQTIKFDDSVLAMYKELGLYSFEGSYFDRLLIGYQLAMYGPEKHITISMKDPELVKLIMLQKKWRTEIASGIEFVQLTRIIEMNGGTITKQQLVDDSAMYGWNAMQVFELLKEMKTHHIISVNKGIVEIL